MNIANLVTSMKDSQIEINVNNLPSQGLFYKDDFKIFITKATEEQIEKYKSNFVKDITVVIPKIKEVVYKNTSFSKDYSFYDIKSVDVIYLFLEIVKYTIKKDLKLVYFSESEQKEKKIYFNSKYFNYFDYSKYLKYYNKKEKCFIVDGFKYTLPTIGVEDSLSNYLMGKFMKPDGVKYNKYFLDFTYFIGHKKTLSMEELDNLVEIFNFDIEEKDLQTLEEIITMFYPFQRYSLVDNDEQVDLQSKINLYDIWK